MPLTYVSHEFESHFYKFTGFFEPLSNIKSGSFVLSRKKIETKTIKQRGRLPRCVLCVKKRAQAQLSTVAADTCTSKGDLI
jgi:hypothetical protein